MDTEQPKKQITVSKSQLGVGGVLVAAIMIINPVKEFFFTRDEGKAQQAQIAVLMERLDSTEKEVIRRLERNADKIIEEIHNSETRLVKNEDRLEKRIERLEIAQGSAAKRGSN